MAMKREYLSVDGEIFGEVTNGVVNFYDRDALGSVVAIEDGAGNTVSTIEYKPFGDVRTYTGENPLSSPRRFLWCGTWGYRFNERYAQYTSHYVRARHYSSLQGMWSTVDPLYPSERAYGYVENRVTVGIDPSGMQFLVKPPNVMPPLRIPPPPVAPPTRGFSIPRATIDPNFPGHNVPDTNTEDDGVISNPYVPYDECPPDRYKKYCDDLHDWYKKYCGSGRYGPRIRVLKDKTQPKDIRNGYAEKRKACMCCYGRRAWLRAGCITVSRTTRETQIEVQMKDSCRACNSWSKFQGPELPIPRDFPSPPTPAIAPGHLIV